MRFELCTPDLDLPSDLLRTFALGDEKIEPGMSEELGKFNIMKL